MTRIIKRLHQQAPNPVVITGLSGTPNVADNLISTNDEKKVKEIASARESKLKEIEMQSKQKTFSIEILDLEVIKKEIVNLIIKSDVQEVLKQFRHH